MTDQGDRSNLLALTAQIVSAHVGKNNVAPEGLPALITAVHNTLASVGIEPMKVVEKQEPAVPIKKSVFPGYLICLEDGKKLKMLKRHLATSYEMTPEQYRNKWNLPRDYPMVAPDYAEKRSALAKSIGLGRKPSADGTGADSRAGTAAKAKKTPLKRTAKQ